MPVFSYSCGSCRHQYEVFSLGGSDGEIRCPMCGSTEARREISMVSIRPSNRKRGDCST